MERSYTISREKRMRISERLASELARERRVGFAYLYGSFLEDESFHDIDVGVYFRDSQHAADVVSALSQRLTAIIKFPVDIRVLNHAPVSFLFHAFKGWLLVNQDDDLLADILESTVRRYLDMAPLLRQGARDAFTV